MGEFNVLVATSVAEEGLDIPEVDMVILFEPVPSEIRTIQRRGRTARRRSGQVIILIAEKTRELSEQDVRLAKLEAFIENHPGFELTDDDVPPRIAKKLASGQISFDEFLAEVYEFAVTPKVVGSLNSTLNQPNLSKAGGGAEPAQNSVYKDIVKSYKTEVY